jgi:hypothetical protein
LLAGSILCCGEWREKEKDHQFAVIRRSLYEEAQLRGGKMAFVSEDEIPKPKELHKIADIWDYILENIKRPVINEASYHWFWVISKPMLTELGDINIEDLTSSQIINFVNSLKYKEDKQLSSESRIKKATEQLKLVISYSIEEGYIARKSLQRNVKRPRGVELDPRHTALYLEEVEQLLSNIQKTESNMMKTLVPAITAQWTSY